MTIKEAAGKIRSRWRDLYQRDGRNGNGNGKGIVCPICGSGSGPNGTGITENPHSPGSLRCWKCGFSGDVIDLIQKEHSIGFAESVQYAADQLGMVINDREYPEKSAAAAVIESGTETVKEQQADYTAEYRVWQNALLETNNLGAAYLSKRGISVETASAMGVGYAAEWRSPRALENGKYVPPSPRLIFPKGTAAYATRDIRPDSMISVQSRKYTKQNQGQGGFFGQMALLPDATDPVIVCEGPMDALSAAEAGYSALAVCGTSGRNALVKHLRENPTDHVLLLALDADTAGQKAAIQLKKDLDKLHIANALCPQEVYLERKDHNEALCLDREQYAAALSSAVQMVLQQAEEARQQEIERYDHAFSSVAVLDSFDERTAQYSNIPTGFGELDKILGGGLYPGLYVIGAVSALGKTTFCLQMMDQIMQSKHDVMMFSLEMGCDELIAKSLSRLAYWLDHKTDALPQNPLTTRGILNGSRRSLYTEKQRLLYISAKQWYRDNIAPRCFIFESNGEIGAAEIQQLVQRHIKITRRLPVVLVDYLQILAPSDVRSTDKQNTDRAVFQLKTLSRDMQIPIVCISSFNRENYTVPVSQASFKESGAIEYSSDVLIGLQYEGMDWRLGEKENDRTSRIRELRSYNTNRVSEGKFIGIQMKVLKNRNGELGDMKFAFNPRYNVYLDRLPS